MTNTLEFDLSTDKILIFYGQWCWKCKNYPKTPKEFEGCYTSIATSKDISEQPDCFEEEI